MSDEPMQLAIDHFLCDACFHGRCYNAEPEANECPCCIEHIEDLEDRLYPRYTGGKYV